MGYLFKPHGQETTRNRLGMETADSRKQHPTCRTQDAVIGRGAKSGSNPLDAAKLSPPGRRF